LTWETVIFYLAAALTVGSALMVAFSRRLINAGFSLLATFGGVAILYGLLGASFLAGTQVLLYIGGILVLLIFAIVLTKNMEHASISMSGIQKVLGVVMAAVLAVVLWISFSGTEWLVRSPPDFEGAGPEGIGNLFMTDYILPFEAISVLLLIALLGATYMVRRKS
jgi:NADH-quinone oxidoreductase subunit J